MATVVVVLCYYADGDDGDGGGWCVEGGEWLLRW